MKPSQYAYIHLPAPNATKQDLHMSREEVKRARLYFKELIRVYHIWVKRCDPEMDGGAAHFVSNTIYVPTIYNKGHFYLCLHEVGHMRQAPTVFEVMDFAFLAEATVIDEYIAEIFALEHAKLFGLDTSVYEKHAKRYVYTYVKEVHQGGTRWADLDERVRDIATNWLGITEVHWSALKWRLMD